MLRLTVPYCAFKGDNKKGVSSHVYLKALENIYHKINNLIVETEDNLIKNKKEVILRKPKEDTDILNFNTLLEYLESYTLEEI